MGTDGHVVGQGSMSDALATNPELSEEAKHEEEDIELDEYQEEGGELTGEAKGKLVVAEEVELGHVSKSACEPVFLHQTFIADTVLII